MMTTLIGAARCGRMMKKNIENGAGAVHARRLLLLAVERLHAR